jgi:hypothetical protein
MSHIPPNLVSGIWTYQSLHYYSDQSINWDPLEFRKENLQLETLLCNSSKELGLKESLPFSKYAILRFENTVTVSALI